MLKINNVEIPDLVFSDWGTPEAIDVYYYRNPITNNQQVSSGFSVIYSKDKENLITGDWLENLEESEFDLITLTDENNTFGTFETIYVGLTCSGIEINENFLVFGFISNKSYTFINYKNESGKNNL